MEKNTEHFSGIRDMENRDELRRDLAFDNEMAVIALKAEGAFEEGKRIETKD